MDGNFPPLDFEYHIGLFWINEILGEFTHHQSPAKKKVGGLPNPPLGGSKPLQHSIPTKIATCNSHMASSKVVWSLKFKNTNSPFSHNHGSVENHPNWKETDMLQKHPFSTEPWLWEVSVSGNVNVHHFLSPNLRIHWWQRLFLSLQWLAAWWHLAFVLKGPHGFCHQKHIALFFE